ncbi:hypothetical protein M422DRAFT_261800 [Sphaerobolus stellatus SS14]|uniref:Uncharacterized protein n=1 Tax=Sphaerobolus stellatus (strain SS14) TaxID=990650 RepID=A0A0C9ULV3_SPHS4|nr:hypothetical protein M422DRAFT_261800 [Sphaerobolus stellatus SS14]
MAEDRLRPEQREQRTGKLADMWAKMTGKVEELVRRSINPSVQEPNLPRNNHRANTLESPGRPRQQQDAGGEDALKRIGENGKGVDW